jgi:streptogramin lyase
MGTFLSPPKWLRLPTRQSPPGPKRNRSLFVEDLEGRLLLSQAIQTLVTLPASATTNIITGPDGNLWAGVRSNSAPSAIDRISMNGSVTSFPLPGDGGESDIVSLTDGPDGNIWFDGNIVTGGTVDQVIIGNITPAGVVTEFPAIPVGPVSAGAAFPITSGPSDDLWFGYNLNYLVLYAQNLIGQVTTAGAITFFPISALSETAPNGVSSLTAAADGDLYFTEQGIGNHLVFGRMSPAGAVTKFRVGDLFGGSVANGLGGDLILTAQNAQGQNEVFRMSTDGIIKRYDIPETSSGAFATYLGAGDGSLWFASGVDTPFRIGQITPSGKVVSHSLSSSVRAHKNGIESMTLGPDGNLYLLDNIGAIYSGIAVYRNTTTVYRLSPGSLLPAR